MRLLLLVAVGILLSFASLPALAQPAPIAGPPATVKELLKDPNTKFVQACMRDSADKVAALLAAGADPNATFLEGHSALWASVGNRDNPQVLTKLLAAGAKPDRRAMYQAGWLNREAALEAMLKAGGKADEGLIGAAHGGHVALVKLLLARGANPNVKSEGSTPLHLAAQQGGPETVKLLVAAGADVNALSDDRKTPLHFCLGSGSQLETAKILVEAGAKLNIPNEEGLTPVAYAKLHSRGTIYDYLLKAAGGKEPRPPSDPLSPAAKKSTADLLAEMQAILATQSRGERPDLKSYQQIHRELLARGAAEVIGEIQKRVQTGHKWSTYFGILSHFGPEAEIAWPHVAAQLDDKEQVFYALMTMQSIKPGGFALLPPLRQQRTAAALYESINNPGLVDFEPGFQISTLIGLGEVSAPHVIKLLNSKDEDFPLWTCQSLQQARFTNEEIKQELIRLVRAGGDTRFQIEVIRALSHFGRGKDAQVKATFLALMQNPPPGDPNEIHYVGQPESKLRIWQTRARIAAMELAQFGPEIIDDVLPLMLSDDPVTCRIPSRTLERLGPSALPRLVELLEHDDPEVASTVVTAIGQMDRHRREGTQPFAIEAVCNALASENSRVAESVASAVTQPLDVHVHEKLLAIAADQKRPAAVRAAAAWAEMHQQRGKNVQQPELLPAIPALIEVVSKGSSLLQQHRSAETLGAIGPSAKDAVPTLRTKLQALNQPLPGNTTPAEKLKHEQFKATVQAALTAIEKASP